MVTTKADIYKNFYSVINTNLSTDAEIVPMDVDDVVSFPHIVINLPEIPKNIETFTRYSRNGSIQIDVLAEDAKTVTELSDEVETLLFANSGDLGVQSLSLGTTQTVPIEKGGKRVYLYTIPAEFRYRE